MMFQEFKIKLSINKILFIVLFYPIFLFFPNVFGKESFFLTTPYFFIVFLFLTAILLFRSKFYFPINFKILVLLIIIVFYNFSSFRYSLPVFFILYVFVLNAVLTSMEKDKISIKMLELIFYLYVIISIPFIFLNNGWDISNRFVGFVGSPTVYAGIMASGYAIVTKNWKQKTFKNIVLYVIIFGFIFMTKTRLLLIFMAVFPVFKYFLNYKSWFSKKKVYIVFLITTMSVYPLYGVVTDLFPSLVSIRYEEGSKDKSFGLRLYLNKFMLDDFKEGTFREKVLGKGNEYSRILVKEKFKADLMPHNDFWRILNDWGALGLVVLLYFIFKISIKNNNVFYISLIYILLFYSNMVFNVFIISLLIIFYHDNYNSNTKK